MTTESPHHGHAHDHGAHNAHGHAHSHAPSAAALAHDPRAQRALLVALAIGLVVLVAEAIAGVVFRSLALLGDAAHVLTDVGAFAIALWAARVARRPPSAQRTFGHGRAEILAALVNGATLLAISIWILVEAVQRLLHPPSVAGAGMSLVAALGFVANVVSLLVLWRAGSSSLNMHAAMLHAAGDLLGSLAALAAGAVIVTTGWMRADPVASILLTLLIVYGAWRLVRESVDILLDAAPSGIDADDVIRAILSVTSVVEVHDVHVWTMSPGHVAASAHVRIRADADSNSALDDLANALRLQLRIEHATLQVRADRGTRPLEATRLMPLDEAVSWATEHIAAAHPDLARGVIAAAAGAAALGLVRDGRLSPVQLSRRTLGSLGRDPSSSD